MIKISLESVFSFSLFISMKNTQQNMKESDIAGVNEILKFFFIDLF